MTHATCHPALEHRAHGLCDRCYYQKYRRDLKKEPLLAPRKYKQMPDFEPDWRRIIPMPALGVQQNAVTEFPVHQCPHCRREGAMVYHGREARCAGVMGGCGHTVYLVRETT